MRPTIPWSRACKSQMPTCERLPRTSKPLPHTTVAGAIRTSGFEVPNVTAQPISPEFPFESSSAKVGEGLYFTQEDVPHQIGAALEAWASKLAQDNTPAAQGTPAKPILRRTFAGWAKAQGLG